MTDRAAEIQGTLEKLRDAASVDSPLVFMEVCGTHTMSAFRCGLHSLIPNGITLLSGPGCPVCVTAQGDIDQMIALAFESDITLFTYGDMLRVPGRRGSLMEARAAGSDISVAYSTLDALQFALDHPDRQVVFAAVGFETTAPATAAAVLRAKKAHAANFSVLTSHKRVVPAMLALLASGEVNLHGFLCPGHVSVIIGYECYRPIVEKYHLPCVIGGFEEQHMAGALATLAGLARRRRAELVNGYPEAVSANGNFAAQQILEKVFRTGPARWRGLCEIPDSGLVLREEFASFDAQKRFRLATPDDREPAGCLCGKIITGLARPDECRLFGTACTPVHPIGPCMVSGEGTCQAWFKYHRSTAAGACGAESGAAK